MANGAPSAMSQQPREILPPPSQATYHCSKVIRGPRAAIFAVRVTLILKQTPTMYEPRTLKV
jgi:hypothetical protein